MLAVWSKGNRDTKNYNCIFILKAELPPHAVLKIAAENLYRIHIDGKFAASGPCRSAHGFTEFDEIALPEPGGVCFLAVEVTGYNTAAFSHANDKPFFAAEVRSDGEVLYNSADFSCFELIDRERVVTKYSIQRAFSECYIMERDRRGLYMGDILGYPAVETETVPANKLQTRSVSYPTYEKVWAGEFFECGRVFTDPSVPEFRDRFMYEVAGQAFDYFEIKNSVVEDIMRLAYEKTAAPPRGARYFLYDIGQNFAGFVKIRVKVEKSAKILVLFDEVLQPDGKINPLRMRMANVLRFVLGAGEFSLESVEPYQLKYIKVIVLEGDAEILRAGLRKFENPDAARLKFSSSDKDMEILMEAARNTFAQNSVDIFTDCPSRERAGWLCDSYYIGHAEKIFTGENKVERHFLFNYANCPSYSFFPSDMIPMCYPADFDLVQLYIANWSLWYILEVGEYFARTGDDRTKEISRSKVENLLKYFSRFENSDGLIEDVDSWVFVEWSRANDFTKGVNYPSNMLYSAALSAAAGLYGIPGLEEKSRGIKAKIREQSLGEDGFFRDNALRKNGILERTENISETCQYYAFFFGIAAPETDEKLFRTLEADFGVRRDDTSTYPNVYKSNAFIGNLMRVDYFSGAGFAAGALRQIKEYYLYQAQKTGTLWEYDTPKKSCCHGFAAYIARIILRGTVGFDSARGGRIYLLEEFQKTDCEAEIPLSATDRIKITVRNGKRTFSASENYEITVI